jgi:hypothetical protein
MPLHLDQIFSEKPTTKRGVPSVKVVAGILGMCWKGASKNRDIAKSIEVSDSVISEALKNYLLVSNLIESHQRDPTIQRFTYSVNFIEMIDYFYKLIEESISHNKENQIILARKEKILYHIMNNRVNVGRSFLTNFVVGEAYNKGLQKVRSLYEAVPELLLLLILSFDTEARKDIDYVYFLRGIYDALYYKYGEFEGILLYVWSGLLWFKGI